MFRKIFYKKGSQLTSMDETATYFNIEQSHYALSDVQFASFRLDETRPQILLLKVFYWKKKVFDCRSLARKSEEERVWVPEKATESSFSKQSALWGLPYKVGTQNTCWSTSLLKYRKVSKPIQKNQNEHFPGIGLQGFQCNDYKLPHVDETSLRRQKVSVETSIEATQPVVL